jgi:hypothetical protein
MKQRATPNYPQIGNYCIVSSKDNERFIAEIQAVSFSSEGRTMTLRTTDAKGKGITITEYPARNAELLPADRHYIAAPFAEQVEVA